MVLKNQEEVNSGNHKKISRMMMNHHLAFDVV